MVHTCRQMFRDGVVDNVDKSLEVIWSPCRQMFREGGVMHPCRQMFRGGGVVHT